MAAIFREACSADSRRYSGRLGRGGQRKGFGQFNITETGPVQIITISMHGHNDPFFNNSALNQVGITAHRRRFAARCDSGVQHPITVRF